MAITFTRIDREFSPSEVEAITGVSTALQRDWRRRGILPQKTDGKWSRFGLDHLIEIMVLKTFSDAGFSVKDVAEISKMAILPTLYFISEDPNSTFWDTELELTAADKEQPFGGVQGRYLVMAHIPGVTHVYARTIRPNTLSAVEDWVTQNKATAFTVLDFENLASLIVERAGPVVRIEARET